MSKARIRVLQFVSSFAVGGTERHVSNLLRAHDRTRFEPLIACFNSGGMFLSDLADLAEGIVEFPIRRLYGPRTWSQQLRLAAHLRARRVQIVHAYGFYANCFAVPAARLAGVPVIVASIRDTGATWTPNQKRAERWINTMTHSIVTNAEAIRKMLIHEGYHAGKIVVIPNGIDIERFTGTVEKSTLREEFGISVEAPMVGVVARIDVVKGLEYFVDAAAVIARKMPEVRFVLVGDASPLEKHQAYRRELEERCRQRGLDGRLVFTGSRSDIPGILSELDLLVLPSLSEGLPNAVLESMAAGVPVVATNVGGLPDIIEDGVSGLLVPPRDANSLARGMERLLRQPDTSRSMARRARETVKAEFSRERMAFCTEEHYLALLRRRAERSATIPGQPLNAGGPDVGASGERPGA